MNFLAGQQNKKFGLLEEITINANLLISQMGYRSNVEINSGCTYTIFEGDFFF